MPVTGLRPSNCPNLLRPLMPLLSSTAAGSPLSRCQIHSKKFAKGLSMAAHPAVNPTRHLVAVAGLEPAGVLLLSGTKREWVKRKLLRVQRYLYRNPVAIRQTGARVAPSTQMAVRCSRRGVARATCPPPSFAAIHTSRLERGRQPRRGVVEQTWFAPPPKP